MSGPLPCRPISIPKWLSRRRSFKSVSAEFIPELLSRHPGVATAWKVRARSSEFLSDLGIAFIAALFLIYALIAIPLHSYSQPLIIMSVIPFGLIGAVLGHVMMGKAISMFSMFGLIALAGVVVNDSLIMVDFINKARIKGVPIAQAVIESGTARFRAIVLTSFTTAAGLMPILLETSSQAQFVIPTAISISFGICFATFITLFLIPSLYMLQEDGFARARGVRAGLPVVGCSKATDTGSMMRPGGSTDAEVTSRCRPRPACLLDVGCLPRLFQVDRVGCAD